MTVVAMIVLVTVLLNALLVACFVALIVTTRRDKQARISDGTMTRLDRLVAMAGVKTRQELIDDALTFYEVLVEEAMKGGAPGVMKSGEFTQLLTPGLLWAKQAGRVTGAAEEQP